MVCLDPMLAPPGDNACRPRMQGNSPGGPRKVPEHSVARGKPCSWWGGQGALLQPQHQEWQSSPCMACRVARTARDRAHKVKSLSWAWKPRTLLWQLHQTAQEVWPAHRGLVRPWLQDSAAQRLWQKGGSCSCPPLFGKPYGGQDHCPRAQGVGALPKQQPLMEMPCTHCSSQERSPRPGTYQMLPRDTNQLSEDPEQAPGLQEEVFINTVPTVQQRGSVLAAFPAPTRGGLSHSEDTLVPGGLGCRACGARAGGWGGPGPARLLQLALHMQGSQSLFLCSQGPRTANAPCTGP